MVRWLSALAWLLAVGQDASGPDPRQRARAAREMARLDSSVLPKLAPMLSDPDVEVRIEAVKAIIAIGTQHSLAPLVQAAGDNDPELQIRATDGLVNFYLPGYVETGLGATLKRAGGGIIARFTGTNDQVIDPFVEVRPEVIDAIGRLASGGVSLEVRANAARAIGVLRGKAAIPHLIAALQTKDDRVLYEVLAALGKIREPSAGPDIAFLLRDLNERVRLAALETTGILGNREALPRLRDILERTENARVRRAALTALAMMPEEATRPLFRSYLHDKDDGLRAAAAEGFARLRNAGNRAELEKAFAEERKMNPRLSLAFALVMSGKNEAGEFSPLQYLIHTLNSRLYRGVALPLLQEAAREPVVRSALVAALGSAGKEEKTGLAHVLGATGGPETIACLEPLTRDPDPDVARQAVRALRTLRARLP